MVSIHQFGGSDEIELVRKWVGMSNTETFKSPVEMEQAIEAYRTALFNGAIPEGELWPDNRYLVKELKSNTQQLREARKAYLGARPKLPSNEQPPQGGEQQQVQELRKSMAPKWLPAARNVLGAATAKLGNVPIVGGMLRGASKLLDKYEQHKLNENSTLAGGTVVELLKRIEENTRAGLRRRKSDNGDPRRGSGPGRPRGEPTLDEPEDINYDAHHGYRKNLSHALNSAVNESFLLSTMKSLLAKKDAPPAVVKAEPAIAPSVFRSGRTHEPVEMVDGKVVNAPVRAGPSFMQRAASKLSSITNNTTTNITKLGATIRNMIPNLRSRFTTVPTPAVFRSNRPQPNVTPIGHVSAVPDALKQAPANDSPAGGNLLTDLMDLLPTGGINGIAKKGGAALSKVGGFLRTAGKAVAPLAALTAVGGGLLDESDGKKIDSLGDIVPEGWNKLNPFEWAGNVGRYGGNKINKGVEAVAGGRSIGTMLYDALHKDEDPTKPTSAATVPVSKVEALTKENKVVLSDAAAQNQALKDAKQDQTTSAIINAPKTTTVITPPGGDSGLRIMPRNPEHTLEKYLSSRAHIA